MGGDPEREKETVAVMIRIYCGGNHGGSDGMCGECSELLDYAVRRIDCCPIRERKVKCSKCTVHCYSPEMRERIREVMRYSGPRMILHPVLLTRHLLDRSQAADGLHGPADPVPLGEGVLVHVGADRVP